MILTLILALIVTVVLYRYPPIANWMHSMGLPSQIGFVALIALLCILLPRLLFVSLRLFISVIVGVLAYLIYLYFTHPHFAQGVQEWWSK